jgi:hypothetical protein
VRRTRLSNASEGSPVGDLAAGSVITPPSRGEVSGAEAARAARRRAERRVAVWLFCGFAVLYGGLTRGHFQATDEISVFETTRSLWEDGDLAIPPILDTVRGRHGGSYSPWGVGQSVAALPLYGLGKVVRSGLERAGSERALRALAGPTIRSGPTQWGGEVEIFFVNLLHAFTTALLVALFFLFSVRLGAAARASLAAALLLGLTSYAAPFATGFYQHAPETLLLFLVFYMLVRDRQSGDWRWRLAAGFAGAALLLVRFQAAVALPALGMYLTWSLWRRLSADRTPLLGAGPVLRGALPFVLPLLAGVVAHGAINALKLGSFTIVGGYASYDIGFSTPLLVGLHGFLFSPGKSIFLFTPLLVLLPAMLPPFARRHPAETIALGAVALSYLLLYAKYDQWHGAWCFGPRFVAAITPFLMLPLASWLQAASRGWRLVVVALGALGLWLQTLNVAVNFSYVHHREGYSAFEPSYGYLFIPELAPPAAHMRALLAGDQRVDLWLGDLYRTFGAAGLFVVAVPWLLVLGRFAWRVGHSLRLAEAAAPQP